MITELSAALTAIKETLSLAKVINDAKTDADIKAATSELLSRLTTLHIECASLCELVRLKEEETMRLSKKIKEFEDFETESVGYFLNQTEAGSFVYSKQLPVNDSQLTVNVCANCFHKRIISILQPAVEKPVIRGFFIHYCPACNSEFKINKVTESKGDLLYKRLPGG